MNNVLVIYQNEKEVIVTTKENEAKMIDEYFTKGGRNFADYDNFAQRDIAISISSRMKVG